MHFLKLMYMTISIAIIILLYKTLYFVNIASGTEKATTYADGFYDEL